MYQLLLVPTNRTKFMKWMYLYVMYETEINKIIKVNVNVL